MTSKFVEQITKAFEEAQAQEQERQNAIEDIIKKELDGLGVTEALIIGNKVKVGGVTFRAIFYGDDTIEAWQVQGDCPKCGQTCWSIHRPGLAGIGAMHVEFKAAAYTHICSNYESLTPGMKLLEALATFIETSKEVK